MTQEGQTPTEEQMVVVPPDVDPNDVEQQWLNLAPGPKASALRGLYEEQQKLVVELQRMQMQKGAEIAAAIVRARAAQELDQPELKQEIADKEIVPKRQELKDLEAQIAKETKLLEAYSTIGRGII